MRDPGGGAGTPLRCAGEANAEAGQVDKHDGTLSCCHDSYTRDGDWRKKRDKEWGRLFWQEHGQLRQLQSLRGGRNGG